MTTKYYLVKAGTSERITDREGKPILYSGLNNAELYSYDIENRLGCNIDVIAVEEYLEEYWLHEQRLKRELNARIHAEGEGHD